MEKKSFDDKVIEKMEEGLPFNKAVVEVHEKEIDNFFNSYNKNNMNTTNALDEAAISKIYDAFCNWYMDDGSYDTFLQGEAWKAILEWQSQQSAPTPIQQAKDATGTIYPITEDFISQPTPIKEVDGWVVISEKPKDYGFYFVSIMNDDAVYENVYKAYWDGEDFFKSQRKDAGKIADEEYCSITHWMPIPKLPTENSSQQSNLKNLPASVEGCINDEDLETAIKNEWDKYWMSKKVGLDTDYGVSFTAGYKAKAAASNSRGFGIEGFWKEKAWQVFDSSSTIFTTEAKREHFEELWQQTNNH